MVEIDLQKEIEKSFHFRWVKNILMISLMFLSALLSLVILFSILGYVWARGFRGLNWEFFTQMPKPVGEEGGGLANGIMGSLYLVLMASLIGIPIGVGTGIFLSEYGKGKIAGMIRFSADVLTSVPSIVIGLFVYALLVKPLKGFSALSGAVALAIIMLPILTRTTEELMKLVPTHIREAGLALGLPRWKVILYIVFRGILPSIMVGIVLTFARVVGETAPLLFTAFGNQYWSLKLFSPIASLPVQIYTYAVSPFEEWHNKAWTAALVLVLFVLLVNAFTRWFLRKTKKDFE